MKWALVLSGGGAKGLAYVGMLKAFEELNFPKPDCIVGCSIGAIIGGLYSSGMKVEEMISFLNSFDINDYTDLPRFGLKQNRISKFLQIGAGINNLITGHGIDSGEKMHTLLNKLLCYQKFENTDIPFYCNATDLCSGKEIIFENGFLADAIRSSASYPIFFKPYTIDGKVYIDGCLKHNTPTWIAKKKGFKNILAITVGSLKQAAENDFNSFFSIVFRCLDIAVSQGDFEFQEENIPTHVLDLDSGFHSYDFNNISEKIEFGYCEVMKHRQELEMFFKKGLFGLLERRKMHKKIIKAFKNEKFIL